MRAMPMTPPALIQPGRVRSWTCPVPRVDAARLLRIHKYSDPARVRPAIREAAGAAAVRAADLAAPAACYVVVEIESLKDGDVTLTGGLRLSCAAFDHYLEGCEYLLAFVVTIGPRLDAATQSLVEDTFEPLDALFLETAGWLTIEAATRKLVAHLRAETAGAGLQFTLRMGPGYEYRLANGGGRVRWDLTQQEALFRLFGTHKLPIELLASSAMKPKMSRSGVFGLHPAR